MKGNDRADRLAGKENITSDLRLGRSEVLRSLKHVLRAQSQETHTINRLEEIWIRIQMIYSFRPLPLTVRTIIIPMSKKTIKLMTMYLTRY